MLNVFCGFPLGTVVEYLKTAFGGVVSFGSRPHAADVEAYVSYGAWRSGGLIVMPPYCG